MADAGGAAAVAEGLLLGSYTFSDYKTDNGKPPLGTATIVTHKSGDKAVKAAVVRAKIVGEAVNRTRSWVNTPARDLTPAAFADAAVAHAKGLKLNIDVLDEKALARRGYGGILGVGQGSANPPRLVRTPTGRRGPSGMSRS